MPSIFILVYIPVPRSTLFDLSQRLLFSVYHPYPISNHFYYVYMVLKYGSKSNQILFGITGLSHLFVLDQDSESGLKQDVKCIVLVRGVLFYIDIVIWTLGVARFLHTVELTTKLEFFYKTRFWSRCTFIINSRIPRYCDREIKVCVISVQ